MIKPKLDRWWTNTIFYQVYLPSFADENNDGVGDLLGLIAKLDHLRGHIDSLNVDALWLSPFYPSGGWDTGYDVTNYIDVDERFGTLADLDQLLNMCHQRGLRVIIDFVLNHTGDQHPWFQEARSSRNNPRRNWYIWRDGKDKYSPPNNWRSFFPPTGSAWTYDKVTDQFYLHSFSSHQPDLNWENPEVRCVMLDIFRFWLNRGIDGFRLDSVPLLGKNPLLSDNIDSMNQWSENNIDWITVHSHIRELRKVASEYGNIALIGEVNVLTFAKLLKYVREDELCLALNFALVHLPWNAELFKKALFSYETVSGGKYWPAWYLNSHDNPRSVTRYDDGSGIGEQRAQAATVLLLTLACTPFLYQGEELGLSNVSMPTEFVGDIIGRDQQRTPFPWQSPSLFGSGAGFTSGEPWLPIGDQAKSKNRADQLSNPISILNLYRGMIRVRQASTALTSGSFKLLDTSQNILAYQRIAKNQKVIVVINFESRPQSIQLPNSNTVRLLITSFLDNQIELSGVSLLHLRANEAIVLEQT